MKIVGFAGSTSSTSMNKKLVVFTQTLFAEDQMEVLDLKEYFVPLFSVDEEKKGFPENVKLFLQKIAEADVIVCSMAEHNRNWTAAFKNLFDWCSRVELKFLHNKPIFLMSTSPGGYGGQNALNIAKNVFPQFGGNVLETFALPKFDENFDEVNGIVNMALLQELKEKVVRFRNQL